MQAASMSPPGNESERCTKLRACIQDRTRGQRRLSQVSEIQWIQNFASKFLSHSSTAPCIACLARLRHRSLDSTLHTAIFGSLDSTLHSAPGQTSPPQSGQHSAHSTLGRAPPGQTLPPQASPCSTSRILMISGLAILMWVWEWVGL